MDTKKEEKRLPDGVTQEQMNQLARQHGQVFPVRVKKDGKQFCGLFRKPKLSDMSAAAAVGMNDPLAAGDLVYNSCKLAADPEMDSDDEVHLAAVKSVQSLFRVLEAEVGEAFGVGV
ncbi:MAG: hypothetical protein KIT10_14590 [Flavobacteriales bacterium]|nr:hypothetical protein [Flavobacteriales bacterium]